MKSRRSIPPPPPNVPKRPGPKRRARAQHRHPSSSRRELPRTRSRVEAAALTWCAAPNFSVRGAQRSLEPQVCCSGVVCTVVRDGEGWGRLWGGGAGGGPNGAPDDAKPRGGGSERIAERQRAPALGSGIGRSPFLAARARARPAVLVTCREGSRGCAASGAKRAATRPGSARSWAAIRAPSRSRRAATRPPR